MKKIIISLLLRKVFLLLQDFQRRGNEAIPGVFRELTYQTISEI